MKKTSTLYSFFSALYLILGFSMATQAQITWIGGGNQYWDESSNWSPDVVPGPGDDVIIPNNSGTIYYYLNSTIESVSIGYNSHLIIHEDATLEADDNHRFGFKVFGTLENHGTISVTNVNFEGIDVQSSGVVNNYGLITVSKMYRQGIYIFGDFNNYKGGEIQVYDAPLRAITLYRGNFTNAGVIHMAGKVGQGLALVDAALFDNEETGEVYLHEDYPGYISVGYNNSLLRNNGLLQCEGTVSAIAAFYLNNGRLENKEDGTINIAIFGGYDGIAMAVNSAVENEGRININKSGSGNSKGIFVAGGDLDNHAGGDIDISGVSTGISINTSRTFTNDGEVKISKCSYSAISTSGTLNNHNRLVLSRSTGIDNRSNGTVLNDGGTIRALGANYQSFRNAGTFTNQACSNIHLEGRIDNTSTGFNNYGYMNCPVDGTNFSGGSDLNNYGIILDPYDRFLPILNNETVRFKMLDNRPSDWYFEDVLDLESWGDYTLNMYWHIDLPLTWDNEVGDYDEYRNEFNLWGINGGIEAAFYYVELTHNPTGCITVVKVPVDPAVQVSSFAGGSSDKLSTDREANPADDSQMQLHVFPNPSSGQFQLQLDQPLPGSATLRLLDATGRTAWAQKAPATSTLSLDLTGQVAPGLYYLQVIQPGQATITKRVVIQAN